MTDGWCPFAEQQRGAESGPSGYPAGAQGQNRPLLFIDHRMGGYKRTLDDSGWRHDNWVGVHFGFGRDGSISQYTSILDASWGNGVAGSISKYDRSNRHLAEIEQMAPWRDVRYAGTTAYALVSAEGVNLLNSHSISSEHEDETIDQLWTPEMVASDIAVKLWCVVVLAAAGMPLVIDADVLGGHFMIDAVNRSNCPGKNWPREIILNALTKGGRMLSDSDIRGALEALTKELQRELKEHNDTTDVHAQRFVIETLVLLSTGDAAEAERRLRFLYLLAGKAFPA